MLKQMQHLVQRCMHVHVDYHAASGRQKGPMLKQMLVLCR